jgi:hypothetical protein
MTGLLLGLLGVTIGCNPVFVNQLSGGNFTPLAPGDQGYVLLHVVNDTDFDINTNVGFDAPGWINEPIFVSYNPIAAKSQRGILVPCPVHEVGMGPLNDPSAVALEFTADDGGQVTVPASAFPFTLDNGVDYNCGDTVLFTIIADRNSSFGVAVIPSFIDASTQTGPFSGPDTFANFDTFLQMTTQPPIPAN